MSARLVIRTITATALVAALSLGPVLLGAGPSAAAASHAVTMAGYAFSPASETVQAGDSVTWTNTDQAPHDVTVTSGPIALHSPTITTGQSWTYTFTVPGTYSYICSIHPDMHATLVVAAPAQAPPTTVRAAVPPVVATHPKVIGTRPVPTTPATTSTTTAPATVPTSMSMPAAAGQPAAAPPAATGAASVTQPAGLNPLLLVAGLVAAVATLCLLLIGSRPDPHRD